MPHISSMETTNHITLGHGSGGKLSREIVQEIFFAYFDNDILSRQGDSAVLPILEGPVAFTTDSYVVDPIFFPGGNIGKLAVCGTINDLAVAGALPKYISAGFILEEGFAIADLKIIVATMAEEAIKAGVKIVTGDTKVVPRGKCDKIFINTSGIGTLSSYLPDNFGQYAVPGDKILINGYVADHGIAVMGQREGIKLSPNIQSDCASLHELIHAVLKEIPVRFARDITRGGLATVLVEIAHALKTGIFIQEENIPAREETTGACEIFGFDPLHVANEGKVLMIVPGDMAYQALDIFRGHPLGKNGKIIGEITAGHPGQVVMETEIGGKRMIDMLAGEQLPRIC